MNELRWQGYVDDGDGLYRVDFYFDPEYGVTVYVDGEMADQLNGTREDFEHEYSDVVYDSKSAYKKDQAVPVSDVWPEA